MDAKKTGMIIQEARKRQNMTQQQLAERLNVSHTTVSKWECGDHFPDVSLLEPIGKELHLTMNELLTGEKEAGQKETVHALVEATMEEVKNKNRANTRKVAGIAVLIMAVILTCVFVFWKPAKEALIFEGNWYSTNNAEYTFKNGEITYAATDEHLAAYTYEGDAVKIGRTFEYAGRILYYHRYSNGLEVLSAKENGFGTVDFARGAADGPSSFREVENYRLDRFRSYLDENLYGVWKTDDGYYINRNPYWVIDRDGTVTELAPDGSVFTVEKMDIMNSVGIEENGDVVSYFNWEMPEGSVEGQIVQTPVIRELPDTYTENVIEIAGLKFYKAEDPRK